MTVVDASREFRAQRIFNENFSNLLTLKGSTELLALKNSLNLWKIIFTITYKSSQDHSRISINLPDKSWESSTNKEFQWLVVFPPWYRKSDFCESLSLTWLAILVLSCRYNPLLSVNFWIIFIIFYC